MYDDKYVEEWLENSSESSFNNTTESTTTQLIEEVETLLNVTNVQSSITKPHTSTAVNSGAKSSGSKNIFHPSPAISSTYSTSSGERVNSSTYSKHSPYSHNITTKSAKRHKLSDDNDILHSDAIEKIAHVLQQPVIIKSDTVGNYSSCNTSCVQPDPVDTCMTFVASILKRMTNEILKYDVMQTVIQTVINASTQDLESSHT